ncbi:SMR family transporter [Salinisphaera sp. T31B1]|uniref:DMT family transporter n=1 Tax=Salinisphaera sp. T31B1 TaxID=727963 RepID=UPI00334013A1
MRHWIWLLAAASAEVGWVAGLKTAHSGLGWLATVVCIAASFGLALRAARHMPATTVYVIFVGLGAAGTVVLDRLVFAAPVHAPALGFLALLLAGVVGLKLLSVGPSRQGSS